jgi:hypothetical protein
MVRARRGDVEAQGLIRGAAQRALNLTSDLLTLAALAFCLIRSQVS